MKAILLYFSATGNTQVAAEAIAENLREKDYQVELQRIEAWLKEDGALDLAGCDLLGIGHPVYGFGAPRIMAQFAKKLPPGREIPTFVFKTAGDIHRINNAASWPLIQHLRKKGYQVFHDSLMAMPANWLVRYDDHMSRQLYLGTLRRSREIAAQVAAGEGAFLPAGPLLRAFARFANYGEDQWGARVFGRFLYAAQECNGCGACARGCPQGNIKLVKGRPIFSWSCMMCMRCIYQCPAKAINARLFKRFILKDYLGGKDLAAKALDPALAEPYIIPGGQTKYQHLLDYVREEDQQ